MPENKLVCGYNNICNQKCISSRKVPLEAWGPNTNWPPPPVAVCASVVQTMNQSVRQQCSLLYNKEVTALIVSCMSTVIVNELYTR